jgi:superfamily II DNA/RNA helicase
MKRDSMLEFDSGRITTAVHAAAVTKKMLQILSGAVYDNQGDYDLIDPERYELVMELAAQRQHSLIAFTWRHQKTELTRLATKLGLDFACIDGSTPLSQRAQIVNDYQAGRYQTLLAQPQSAGHGLTLTKGASIIWASPTYNLEHYLQFNRRIYRIGQTQRTEIINTCAKGTYEETAYTMLQGKKESQNIFLDFLSPILEPA